MTTNLNAQDILEKQFKRSMKGYNVDEVDSYLNTIIEDYEYFEKTIQELTHENERLKEEIVVNSKKVVAPQPTNTTNFDILKRLSNLEKHVFGNKLDE